MRNRFTSVAGPGKHDLETAALRALDPFLNAWAEQDAPDTARSAQLSATAQPWHSACRRHSRNWPSFEASRWLSDEQRAYSAT